MALDPNKDVMTNLFQSAQKAVPSQALEVNSQGASVKANTTSQQVAGVSGIVLGQLGTLFVS